MISVVIVTYNSEREIRPCLKSVLPQVTDLDGEVIIVDNASTDGTLRVIEGFNDKNEHLKLIKNNENLGFSRANNQALELALGEFVFFLNPDTEVSDGAIDQLINALRKDNSLGALAPQLRFPNGTIQYSCRRFPTYGWVLAEVLGLSRLSPRSRYLNGWKMGDFDHTTSQEVDQPAAAALMVRGDLLRELGGFDETFPMFFSDVDLCRRIWQKKKILYYPEAVVIHHGGASVKRERPRMIVSAHLSFIRYFTKWHKGPIRRVMNALMAILLFLSMLIRVLSAFLFPIRKTHKRTTL